MMLSLRRVGSRVSHLGPIVLLFWAAAAPPLGAAVVPDDSAVNEKAFRDPDLYVRVLERPVADLGSELAAGLASELHRLGAEANGGFYDWRSGRWGSLVVSVPLVPGDGVGNSLGNGGSSVSQRQAWEALTRYVREHRDELRIDPSQFGTPSISIHERGNFIQVHAPRVVQGIPVRDSGITAVINHGNLVLLGLQNWGNVEAAVSPVATLDGARDAVAEHLRPFTVARYRDQGHLELVPMARGDEVASVTRGEGYAFRLAWVVSPDVAGSQGRWEGLVDATSGKLIAFQDTNRYAVRRVVGGVYPVSNDQRPPDGIEQAGWPMPFTNIAGGPFTTSGGIVPACIAGNIQTTLNGQFMRMVDTCGAINENSAGDIDLGTSGGDDCVVPAGHSAGDTHSSRSGFYEMNRIKEQAKGYLTAGPANTWLNAQLTSNMNINQTCNAFWNGSTVNFFRSGGGCGNTGEIAGVFDHEWGHGLDDFGANGNVAFPGEDIADIRANQRLNDSCVGRGFFLNQVCGGYGDPCVGTPATGCTGVRDADFAQHVSGLPHGITWAIANCGGCNGEVHCTGQVGAEVGWDLHFRDLQAAPFNFDSNTALELATRLYYLAAETVTATWGCAGNCQNTGTCGCGSTNLYPLMLAADDDNGNIPDGTPHMSAIRAAFERHQIHCVTQPVINSGCAGGPTTAPTVVATSAPGGVNLSWGAVAGASNYAVYKTEGVFGCDFGKVKIGTTSGTTFSDTAVLDGRTYFYNVLPIGANTSCFGLMSACASATPTVGADPCGGGNTIEFNFTVATSGVAENAGSHTISVTLTTSDGLPSSGASSVNFATADGSANAGSDYTPNAGTLNFPAATPNGSAQTFNVAILDDVISEGTETFTAGLSGAVGGTVGGTSTHTVSITDNDPLPDLTVGDVAELELNAGATDRFVPVTLSAPSGSTVTAVFATADGTATTADNDYVPTSGSVIFGPGETAKAVTVSVIGDLQIEADETYFVSIGPVTGANVVDGVGQGTIINDDILLGVNSKIELIHGSRLSRNLAATGAGATQDFFPIQSKANRSWEVVVDGTGGDIVGAGGPNVVRLDSDGVTVVQTATSIGSGVSKSMRWETGATDFNGFVRVESAGCTTTCTAEDVYRVRAYDTTYAIARFNNSATQVTIMVIQNTSTDTVTGNAWLWSAAGPAAATQPFTLAPNATFVINTSTLATGAGTITVSHDGRYGSLSGKAVAVETATGFTFDTAMTARGR